MERVRMFVSPRKSCNYILQLVVYYTSKTLSLVAENCKSSTFIAEAFGPTKNSE